MTLQSGDYVDVAARSRELGCRVPGRIALLPGNFVTAADAGELCFHEATPHIRSAWRSVGLEDEGPGSEAPLASARVPLVAYFGADLSDGPTQRVVTIALGMVTSVLSSHPCSVSPGDILLDIVVERPSGRGCTCIEYQGDAFGIVGLCRDVRRIWADTRSIGLALGSSPLTRGPSRGSGSQDRLETGQHRQSRRGRRYGDECVLPARVIRPQNEKGEFAI